MNISCRIPCDTKYRPNLIFFIRLYQFWKKLKTMKTQEDFFRHPGWEEIIKEIQYQISQSKRPPSEIILDDVDLCIMLKCSKRKTAELRANKEIAYSKTGKVYYLLSDVLAYIERNRIEADCPTLNSRFK